MADIVLMLGKPERPVDAIEQNSIRLAEELTEQGRPTTTLSVDWGGSGALNFAGQLRRQLATERPSWVVMHYTALYWGPRAFPVVALIAAWIVRRSGARLVLDFQEGTAKDGSRAYDHVRAKVQKLVMKWLAGHSAGMLVHLPVESGPAWLMKPYDAVFVPSGSNIELLEPRRSRPSTDPFTILVFCLTDTSELNEGPELAAIVRKAAPDLPKNTLLRVMGRGAELSRGVLRSELAGTGIALDVQGLLPEAAVAAAHRDADVVLFVREGITSYRSTAATALAFGLPIVAYATEETHPPITDAGVICVRYRDTRAAADALVRVASDEALRKELSAKSFAVYEKYFSWKRIAETISGALSDKKSRTTS